MDATTPQSSDGPDPMPVTSAHSPPPRNSLEDADSTVTRKRPRLDSGERAHHNMMHASAPSSSEGTDDRRHHFPATATNLTTRPADEPDSHIEASTKSPSKVTINLRGHTHPQLTATSDKRNKSRLPVLLDTTALPPVSMSADDGGTESLARDEVETSANQQRKTSPELSVKTCVAWQQEKLRRFPGLQSASHDWQNQICELLDVARREPGVLANLLGQIAEWMDDYFLQSEHMHQFWVELTTEASTFWRSAASLLSFLTGSELSATRNRCQTDLSSNSTKLNNFLASYITCIVRMVKVDCMALEAGKPEVTQDQKLFSSGFLTAFRRFLLSKPDGAPWRGLEQLGTDLSRLAYNMTCAVGRCSSLLDESVELIAALLGRTGLNDEMTNLLKAVLDLVSTLPDLIERQSHEGLTFELESASHSVWVFFDSVDRVLRSSIKRQSSALSNELLHGHFLVRLVELISASTTIVSNLLDRYKSLTNRHSPNLDQGEKEYMAESLWKSDLFERCIRDGRMEVRIAGLDALQGGLIRIYNAFIKERTTDDRSHPIAEAVGDQLLQNRLVEYVLSADSHLQIISRSANVVGFLAVSGRWSDEQTDSTWDSALKTEDPRASETIMETLNSVTRYLDPKDLSYLIERIQDLSVSKFEPKVQRLLISACKNFADKTTGGSEAFLVPAKALTSLLRKTSTDRSTKLARKQEMWKMAHRAFTDLTVIEWSEAARMAIYQDCFKDIASRSSGTSGSCAIVRQVLERYRNRDLKWLLSELGATSLIASDFEELSCSAHDIQLDLEDFMFPLDDRLRMLQWIIFGYPEAITPEITDRLWPCMFAERSIGPRARGTAWESISMVAANSLKSNNFIDRCMKNHMPGLHPRYYSRSLLTFANHVCEYELRIRNQESLNDSPVPFLPLSRQLFWQLAVGAEDEFVSRHAAQALIQKAQGDSEKRQGANHALDLIEEAITEVMQIAAEFQQALVATDGADRCCMLQHRFSRVYFMLQHFIAAVQEHLPPSPSNRSDSEASQSSISGERIQIEYYISDRGKSSATKSVDINSQISLSDLLTTLRTRTGLTLFNLILGGVRLDLDSHMNSPVASLGFKDRGKVILHRVPGSEVTKMRSRGSRLRPAEGVVMRHFGQFHELLGAREQIAGPVLRLLSAFDAHEGILRLVSSPDNDWHQVLPLQYPFKLAYALHAIRLKQNAYLEDGMINTEFMCHSVLMMANAVIGLELPCSPNVPTHALWLAMDLLQTILIFLKEPVSPSVSMTYFQLPKALVAKLYDLLDAVETLQGADLALSLQTFGVLLEVSRLNDDAWQAFHGDLRSQRTFESLVLSAPDPAIRKQACQTVRSIFATLDSSRTAAKSLGKVASASAVQHFDSKERAFKDYFWQTLIHMLPRATTVFSKQCEQYFSFMTSLFDSLPEESVEEMDLQSSLELWIKLLHEYQPHHVIGHDNTEWAVKGLCDLITQPMILLDQEDKVSHFGADFYAQIFDKLLFPSVSGDMTRDCSRMTAPVLGSGTRSALCDLVSRAAVGNRDLIIPLSKLNRVLNDPNMANVALHFDRSRCLRAPAGYPGLENLSNTCYLNSLVTQLFMNPHFRGFILQCEIIDPKSQALLGSLQRLFAEMQDGWMKFINTKELAESIETFDGPLDPSIQMDADEAFNLLFERLEQQLVGDQEKEAFRKLYGGKSIQQIKSKECEHVSERLTPFIAIQCDIQGKHSLIQSLDAYIEGEMMEGDNKYKCSSCDRYVNAVKRECLQEVPDNLIFHLKRFDYDLMLNTRNKVNDHFMFPEIVDMAPYNIDNLERSGGFLPDEFVLVGVLVHNGTAESGHYYSYIRERPEGLKSWLEFNDTEVSRFDLNSLPDSCFGGEAEGFNQAYPKAYNAYMLFYQRKSSLNAYQPLQSDQLRLEPTKVRVEERLAARVATHNETLARTYSLFGQEHLKFVKDLLSHVCRSKDHACSADHYLEDSAIMCALLHLEKVFGKDLKRQGASDMLLFLFNMTSNCTRCCLKSIQCLVEDDSRLRSLLLRQSDSDLRSKTGSLLVHTLRSVKTGAPELYSGFHVQVGNSDLGMNPHSPDHDMHNILKVVLTRLHGLQNIIPANFRAWPEFYQALCDIVSFGDLEKSCMHSLGFLQHSLEVLCIDPHHCWVPRDQSPHSHYVRLVEKRGYNLTNLLKFVTTLLTSLWPTNSENPAHSPIRREDCKEGLSPQELRLVLLKVRPTGGDKSIPWVLERAAIIDDATAGYRALEALVRWTLENENSLGLESSIVDLIAQGIVKNPAELAAPYLRIAVEFMQTSASPALIEYLLQCVADGSKTIENSGGIEHLDFFRRALHVRNDRAFPGQPFQMTLNTMRLAHVWGPALLDYPDSEVAQQSCRLIERVLFEISPEFEDDEELADARATAISRIWTPVSQRVHKFVRDNRALDESKRYILDFCCTWLSKQSSQAEDDSGTNDSFSNQYRALIARASDLIVLLDEAGSNGFESDDLTEVSSSYESPSAVEIL